MVFHYHALLPSDEKLEEAVVSHCANTSPTLIGRRLGEDAERSGTDTPRQRGFIGDWSRAGKDGGP